MTKAPFSFTNLGQVSADASGELDELSADDILESDDIGALEAAAANIQSFAAPPSDPSGFEVGEVGAFDEVEVEGLDATPLVPAASTLLGFPAAPITSPLPLESVIVAEPIADRTVEIRPGDMARVDAAVAALDSEPAHTEVLSRAAMPCSLLQAAPRVVHTPPPSSVHTPAAPLAATAAAWQNGRAPSNHAFPAAHGHVPGQPGHGRHGSIAPVALDLASLPRPTMPSIPQAAAYFPAHAHAKKSGISGLAIGGIVFAAAALIGLVGVGGFAATRALSNDEPTVSKTSTVPAPEGAAAAAAAAVQAAPSAPESAGNAPAADPAPTAAATFDVSSLPSARSRAAAPTRGITGSAPAAAPVVAAPRTASGSALPAPGSAAQGTPASNARGTALPPPGAAAPAAAGNGPTALPPPAAPAAAAPAAAAAGGATTGVINVDPSLRVVLVDGSYRRATDGVVTVSCGTHKVKVGMNDAQLIKVPCGGAVSL